VPGEPIGRAAIRRSGDDVTVVTYGSLVRHRIERRRVDELRLEASTCDSLNPLDFDTIAASVRKTGHVVRDAEGPRTLASGRTGRPASPGIVLRPRGTGVRAPRDFGTP